MCEPRFDIKFNPFRGLLFAALFSIPFWAVAIFAAVKIYHHFVH